MEIENRVDPNEKERLALTFFNTDYEIEKDFCCGNRIILWPSEKDLKDLTNYLAGPMGSNMYPVAGRGNGKSILSLDAIDAMKYYYDNYWEYRKFYKKPEIKNVIFNDPATIVFWNDGTKTVVKCSEDDVFDPEKGLTMAIAKKIYGPTKDLKKWLPKEEEKKIEVKPLINGGIAEAVATAINAAIKNADNTLGNAINNAAIKNADFGKEN